MVNMAGAQNAALPWPSNDAEDLALAQGQIESAQVLACLARGRQVVQPYAGGHLVMHHWAAEDGVHEAAAPVLLLHGGSGSWTHWVRNIAALTAAGHEVWTADLPGCGASDLPPQVSDADSLLPYLAQALEAQFPLQSLRVVGFSFGGLTAGLLAAAYPHLVRQLVLVGAPGLGLSAGRAVPLKGWRHLQSAQAQLASHIFNLGALMLHDPSGIDRDTLALHIRNVSRDRLQRRRISRTAVLLEALAEVSCPVAAIYGEHDVLYPGLLDQAAAVLAGRVREWQGLQQVRGAGHWVQYEQPEAFHAQLLPLLAAS